MHRIKTTGTVIPIAIFLVLASFYRSSLFSPQYIFRYIGFFSNISFTIVSHLLASMQVSNASCSVGSYDTPWLDVCCHDKTDVAHFYSPLYYSVQSSSTLQFILLSLSDYATSLYISGPLLNWFPFWFLLALDAYAIVIAITNYIIYYKNIFIYYIIILTIQIIYKTLILISFFIF